MTQFTLMRLYWSVDVTNVDVDDNWDTYLGDGLSPLITRLNSKVVVGRLPEIVISDLYIRFQERVPL